MKVMLYGKKDCGLCASAKDKLQRMNVPFKVEEIDYYLSAHTGWRSDGSVDVQALHCLIDGKIPMIVIDGVPFEYTKAMRRLKEIDGKDGQKPL